MNDLNPLLTPDLDDVPERDIEHEDHEPDHEPQPKPFDPKG